jgi:hypothetical protein
MVTIWISARTYERIAGWAPDPAPYNERRRGHALTLEPRMIDRQPAVRPAI